MLPGSESLREKMRRGGEEADDYIEEDNVRSLVDIYSMIIFIYIYSERGKKN